jgi:hypothetical protein
MMRKAVSVLALLALVGSIGCGGDDDTAPGGGSGGVGATGAGATGAAATGAGATGAAGTTMGTAGMAGTTAMIVPGSATWGAVYKEVLVDGGCSGGPFCHGSGSVTGGLDMSDKDKTYDLLINAAAGATTLPPSMAPNCKDSGKKRVVPGMPDMSLMLEKMEKMMPSCGTVMPPGGMIEASKIQQVRMWIMLGAKED